jgi:aspartyl-tRNA synthetase
MSPAITSTRPPAFSHRYYSKRAAELDADCIGQRVRVAGWVHRVRELGSVIFLEVRDPSGVVQAVVEASASCFELVRQLRQESVVSLSGELVLRQAGARNPKLPSGDFEIRAAEVELLSSAEPLPFPVHDDSAVPEELRLKYRYLDLRRQRVRRNILLRSRVIARLRELMAAAGFIEFQTPILTASSPEGARDFLVPSRIHPGKCYALPQAPQIFKQLLMVSGFDRYFQIAPCFRDEDARADRSPGEFYQLDVELAFVTEDDIFASMEPVLHAVFAEFGRYPSSVPPFPRIPYREALLRYASDKPDLRNPLTLAALPQPLATRLSELGSPFVGEARLLRAPNGATLGRRFFDERCAEAARQGGKLIMLKAFALAGYPASEVEARVGGLLRAFRHGAPPHGGLAPGIDRMLMLLAGEPNLREVIAFPFSQSAQDLDARRPEQRQRGPAARAPHRVERRRQRGRVSPSRISLR